MSVISCETSYKASMDDEVYCKEQISQIKGSRSGYVEAYREYRHQLLTLEDFQFRRADNHPDMPSVNLKVKDLRVCMNKLLQSEVDTIEKLQIAKDRLAVVKSRTQMELQKLQIALRREAGIYDHPWQDVDSGVFKSVTT
tara:strand:+ start:1075 stop:1494 length:420 start_codon:yes stop_codon:yes gene_type:complete